jgi:hypothetical protein
VAVAEQPPPGVVLAAAVLTWLGSSGTAVLTLLLAVAFLVAAAPVLDVFDAHDLRLHVAGAALLVIAFSAAADLLAWFVLRGHRWARWGLIGFASGAAVGGAMLGYYVAPLVVTAAALAVIVLLLLPSARAWFRSRGPQGRVGRPPR